MKKLFTLFTVAATMSIISPVVAQTAKETASAVNESLPNGASSLSESYGLWTVTCGVREGKKHCSMVRQEMNAQNQPVVTMEISANAAGDLSGVLVVPFGVLVTKPVRFQVDDGNSVINSSVRTCVPGGCIVPVAFDKTTVAALRAGKRLKLFVTSAANGEPTIDNMVVQLNGFSNALNRLSALQK